jgi:8-oxo-dGTP diphosphatase
VKKLVQVAAAVILRPDGSFLLGQRAPGTFYPGYWEFPGGKVEPGETPHDALVRELAEELGIEVLQAYPWIVREHVYEHAHVRLHFFRVVAWRGEVQDHVHSALAWQRAEALSVSPMLPANAPVLRGLTLPDFCAVSDAATMGVAAQLTALERALKNGLRLLQLREPGLAAAERLDFCHRAVSLCHQHGARALVNGDAELARSCGADGLHLPARALAALNERPSFDWVGASCHDRAELEKAATLGLDFALLGSVKPTASHPDQPALGWDRSTELLREAPLPIYLIGGLERGDLEKAWGTGAHGVAAIRAAWSY